MSTILTLWTAFFQAWCLGLNLLPTFARLLALLGIWGLHLACFLECLGTSKMEPECWRKYDSYTLDLLFPGPNSRLEFTTDLFWTFGSFRHFGVPFGRPFGSLWLERPIEHDCAEKYRKKRDAANPEKFQMGVLAPKEEDLRPPSSLKACRIWRFEDLTWD